MRIDNLLFYAGIGIIVSAGGTMSVYDTPVPQLYNVRRESGTSAFPVRFQRNDQLQLSSYSIVSGEYNVPRKNYRARYARIAKTEWFSKSYVGQSLGEVIGVDY